MAIPDTLRHIARLMHLGSTFERDDKLADARQSFQNALTLARRAQLDEQVFQASESLAAIEARAGNLAQARGHLRRCLELRLELVWFIHALVNLVGLEREDRQYGPAFVLGAVAYNLLVELGPSWERQAESTSATLDLARANLGRDWLTSVEVQARALYPPLRARLADQAHTPDDFRIPLARWLLDRGRDVGMSGNARAAESLAVDLWTVGTREPTSPALLHMVSRGLRNAVVTQGRHGTLDAAEAHFSRLQELARRWPADREIQSQYAPSVLSLLTYRLASDRAADLSFATTELRSLVERFADEPRYRQLLADVEQRLAASGRFAAVDRLVDLVNRILDGSTSALNQLLSGATPTVLATLDALAAAETDPDRRPRVEALREMVATFMDAVAEGSAAPPELRRSRDEDPERAQPVPTPATESTLDPAQVVPLIGTFINARDARARRHLVERYPQLLSAETDALLGRLIEFAKNTQPGTVQYLEQGRTLLRNWAVGGIDTPSEDRTSPPEPPARTELEIPGEFAADYQEVSGLVGSLSTSAIARDYCVALIERLLQELGLRHPTFRAQLLNLLGIAHRHSQSSEHLRQAIRCYEQALALVTIDSSPSLYAATHANMGTALAELQGEDRQSNLRRAIDCYEQALLVNTLAASPFEYARDMYNLGTTYAELPGSEYAERAKRCFAEALRVFTRQTAPLQFANVQNALGAVLLRSALEGDVADARGAVVCFEDALSNVDSGAAPLEYAAIQANLGRAYNVLAERDRVLVDRALACLHEALRIYTPETTPVQYAATQLALAAAYSKRPDDHDARRQTVGCYEAALNTITFDTSPDDYLTANLGLAASLLLDHALGGGGADVIRRALSCYEAALRHLTPDVHREKRIMALEGCGNARAQLAAVEDRAVHLERAIDCYEELSRLRSRETEPEACASALNALGALHMEMLEVEADRTARRKQALDCFQEGLQLVDRETHPQIYAQLLTNLAVAVEGRRAIELLHAALAVRTPEHDPSGYSLIMHNLGTRYAQCPSGDLAADLSRAVECYREALRFRSFDSTPGDYAFSMLGLAGAYVELPLGDRDSNLRLAIECGEQALRHFSRETRPREYAQAEANIANARAQLDEDRFANLQLAAAGYERALSGLTPEADPRTYGLVRMNQGVALGGLLERGSVTVDRQHVIDCYEEALKWLRPEASPLDYAKIQINLGNVYGRSMPGDSAPDRERAAVCYRRAIELSPLETEPRMRRFAAMSLGKLCFDEGRWDDAHTAYAVAIEASDVIHRASAAESSRLSELASAPHLYADDAYCLAKLSRIREAVERLEDGRTRLLADALSRDRAELDGLEDRDRAAFADLRSRIRRLEMEARGAGVADEPSERGSRTFSEVSDDLRAARSELDLVIDRVRLTRPDFMARTLAFDDIAAAVRPSCPTIYLVTTGRGSVAVILCPDGAHDVVWLDAFSAIDLDRLLFWRNTRDGDGEVIGGIVGGQTSGNRDSLSEELDLALPSVQEQLMGPLGARLEQRGFERATLIPYGQLALLPLHACRDRITWSHVPSSRLLKVAAAAATDRSSRPCRLLGIGDPLPSSEPLAFARIELEEIAPMFPEEARCVLIGADAKLAALREALPGCTHLHFACHGTFDEHDPLDSCLYLAGEERVALRDLMDGHLDVRTVQVAVLSACQTAVIDFERAPDEAIGFPAGLLQAGVPGIISTLWPVDDLSTALMMSRFYEELLIRGRDGALALRTSQEWLRSATAQELALARRYEWLQEAGDLDEEDLQAMRYFRAHPETRPFAHPYYWAGFIFTGV